LGDKLLIHISDRDKWQVLCQLIADFHNSPGGRDVHIVVVADIFAGGVCLACSSDLQDQLQALVDRGHRILVCTDSLNALKLRSRGLPACMEAVPNSLSVISQLRAEGFQYIKV